MPDASPPLSPATPLAVVALDDRVDLSAVTGVGVEVARDPHELATRRDWRAALDWGSNNAAGGFRRDFRLFLGGEAPGRANETRQRLFDGRDRRDGYAAARPCSRSAMMSSLSSSPIDRRTTSGPAPAWTFWASVSWRCVVEAG